MDQRQKIITTVLWATLVLVMVGVVVGQFWMPRQQSAAPLPEYFGVASFHLTDQSGHPFSDGDLHGKPYVAALIFTTCADVCPIMTGKMAQVQKQTPALLQLVSFSVNPEYDTPSVLRDYAKRYGADERRWHFLTGSRQQMNAVAMGLKLPMSAAVGQSPIGHSDKLLLVDAQGTVRGIYDGRDDEAVKHLITDGTQLASGRRSGAP